MIKLIITASDELYERLSQQARAEGLVPKRARDVLQGYEQASRMGRTYGDSTPADPQNPDKLSGIVVDMSLRAADTLLETLSTRRSTSGIPLTAVKCDGQALPVALRRLCTGILEADGKAPPCEQEMAGP